MKTSILSTIVPQYIIDNKGKKTGVVLDFQTFTTMVDELEELYDILEAEKILAKGDEEEGKSIEEIEKSLNKKD
jgi:peptidoglycan hydrolase CwlO-like protein